MAFETVAIIAFSSLAPIPRRSISANRDSHESAQCFLESSRLGSAGRRDWLRFNRKGGVVDPSRVQTFDCEEQHSNREKSAWHGHDFESRVHLTIPKQLHKNRNPNSPAKIIPNVRSVEAEGKVSHSVSQTTQPSKTATKNVKTSTAKYGRRTKKIGNRSAALTSQNNPTIA
jgi:hypothetical protein